MATDAFGEEIKVGDFVGYVTGGRYQDAVKGFVLGFGKDEKLIKIEVTVSHAIGITVGSTKWVHPHRMTRTLETFQYLDNGEVEL